MIRKTDPTPTQLDLNPGAARRRKSSCCSGFKCLFSTGVVFLVLLIVVSAVNFVQTAHKSFKSPHQWLYQNATLDQVKDRGAVVQPLIDVAQTFDILATVWMRNREADADVGVQEKIIYSGKVFEGLKLKDKHVRRQVELKVPTSIFKHQELSNYDLRGSFVLIPTTPSLLDHLTNYSSFLPASMFVPPRRPYPDAHERTMVDEVIDSFGTSIPLLEFNNLHSRCAGAGGHSIDAQPSKTPESPDDDDDDDDYSEDHEVSGMERHHGLWRFPFTTTKGKPVLGSHPYIVTRTQLRVVDMTKLYNRKAYNKFHKDLKSNACRSIGPAPNLEQSWQQCGSDFFTHGNCDTRLRLEVADGATGKKRTEWAYAPFLSVTDRAWGPKDLVAVPVNREKCVGATLPDEEYINLTWKLSYSGGSPRTIMFSNALGWGQDINMTDTEYNKAMAHHTIQSLQGLHGHRFEENTHPRRMFFLETVVAVLRILVTIFQIHYWYTRVSTVGISVPATFLFAASMSLNYILLALIQGYSEKWNLLWRLWKIVAFNPLDLMLRLVMFKAVMRAEVRWWGYIPTIWMAPATHKERANARFDSQIGWRTKALFVLSMIASYYVMKPHEIYLVAPIGPKPEIPQGTLALLDKLGWSLVWPTATAASLMQVHFNHRSRTFAGAYKVSALLEALRLLVKLGTLFAPRFMGGAEFLSGFPLQDAISMAVVGVTVFQAVRLPGVSQDASDDSE